MNRWTSADPGGMVDGPNFYGYVSGNVLRYFDPMGMSQMPIPYPPSQNNGAIIIRDCDISIGARPIGGFWGPILWYILGPYGGHWEVVEGHQGNFRCYLPTRRTYSGTRRMRIRVGEGENAHYETVCCNEASCSDIRNCIRNPQNRRYLDLFF